MFVYRCRRRRPYNELLFWGLQWNEVELIFVDCRTISRTYPSCAEWVSPHTHGSCTLAPNFWQNKLISFTVNISLTWWTKEPKLLNMIQRLLSKIERQLNFQNNAKLRTLSIACSSASSFAVGSLLQSKYMTEYIIHLRTLFDCVLASYVKWWEWNPPLWC